MDATVNPLVVIVGETASGKSDLAIELAQKFKGEIIAADSRTIYKGMDIGTAKPSKKDQATVPHHLLDVIEPNQKYNVVQFQQDATALIDEIKSRGKLPIMVGGSGLYINSVIFDYQFTDSDGPRDPQNSRHLLKDNTNKSSTNLQQLRPNTLVIGLRTDKNVLEQRINARVEQMVENGLVEEAKVLASKYGWDNQALEGSGYQYFAGCEVSGPELEEVKKALVRNHMNLAKKQRTWFKRNKYIQWIDSPTKAQALVQTFLTRVE